MLYIYNAFLFIIFMFNLKKFIIMKEIVGQTKEFVKDLMISAFETTMPELKKIDSFPFIARADILGDTRSMFWIWILPNGVAITYGKDFKHQFDVSSQYKNVFLAEVGFKTKDSSLYTKGKAQVVRIEYLNSGKKIVDNVLMVEAQDNTPHNNFGVDDFQHEPVQVASIRLAENVSY